MAAVRVGTLGQGLVGTQVYLVEGSPYLAQVELNQEEGEATEWALVASYRVRLYRASEAVCSFLVLLRRSVVAGHPFQAAACEGAYHPVLESGADHPDLGPVDMETY